ncbi:MULTISPECIES: siderophore-interacting protein [unclassified Pseudomonas]|uniref:siderophore-interacting protein n=1 Tax=unclassified Pseudomonas TaxID=196821 RepID=UPI000C889BA3|nr:MULTISPECIES: siderophore-interacting protein [unclassified Pseudomonas]PNA00126.1 NADPH-dependent ferric siderophore reductase [Pseudomonas sp. FW305-BF15]PNB78001.1 NADPH-dependent ferric siderophore reductase [Pseudomonas sp. FW305-BF6]
MASANPYKLFDVVLRHKQQLSPHLMRITLASPTVTEMATWAPDQRVKLFFPAADGSPAKLSQGEGWYARFRSMLVDRRPAMRTYTIRHLRAESGEVDIDFVLHGETGPASRWALRAQPGESMQILAPDSRFSAQEAGGFEWKPPQTLKQLLLVADATALPAAMGILEELATLTEPPQAQAFFEVDSREDMLAVPDWPGLSVQWLIRDHATAGTLMVEAVQQATLPVDASPVGQAVELADVDIEEEILWEIADTASECFYGWIAGESVAVMSLRKYLIKERGIPRESLNLMGYWRHNKSGG